jgi:hypothetical protein
MPVQFAEAVSWRQCQYIVAVIAPMLAYRLAPMPDTIPVSLCQCLYSLQYTVAVMGTDAGAFM